jgi:hypothetical protein
MQWAKILSVGIIILMAILMGNILINDSFNTGIGMDRFIAGLKDPWQAFIGFDMMSGLFLMFGWIIFRQKGSSLIETITWVLLGNWWGNIVIAAYILVALRQSDGEPTKFFMGARAGPLRSVWDMPSLMARGLCLVGAVGVAVYATSAMRNLNFSGLPAWAFVPAFAPVVLGLILLAFPRKIAR